MTAINSDVPALQTKKALRNERLRRLGKCTEAVSLVCEEVEGGLYKRIDEHRELVRLLIADAPDFLASHPWVASWLTSQIEFLVSLESVADFKPENCEYQKTETWPYAMPVLPCGPDQPAIRNVIEIEADLRTVRGRGRALQNELDAVKLAQFLHEAGVPDGARPIFGHKSKAQRVLVTRFDGLWAHGFLIKKDGTVSDSREVTLYSGEYQYIGD